MSAQDFIFILGCCFIAWATWNMPFWQTTLYIFVFMLIAGAVWPDPIRPKRHKHDREPAVACIED